MSSPETQASLANPPVKQTKMIKIKAIYPIRLNRDGAEKIYTEGQIAMVTEEEATEFCDRTFDLGSREYFGNFDKKSVGNTVVKRAVRV